MKAVSGLSGVESVSLDMNDKKLTVIGDIDAVRVVAKLRKFCYADIISVGPAKEEKKDEPKKDDTRSGLNREDNTVTAALLGLKAEEHENQKEEDDLKECIPLVYDDIVLEINEGVGRKSSTRSYKDMVTGSRSQDDVTEKALGEDGEDEEEEEGTTSLKIEEKKVGDYECPDFIFSGKEEKRIFKPWRRGVIVKMLGRKIGFKALENRLQQLWARIGVINIVDLGNDYYLTTFSSEEDQYTALMEGPWLIYDHYLSVREWSPNFNPRSDAIEKVAVWVRFSSLPIEYYDARILTFIGNRIGTTVKVDRNTLKCDRGKYARLCVEVDLTKSLLAMFSIKGRYYKVEYEGLHLLCLNCGKFGHYKEGCGENNSNRVAKDDGKASMGGETSSGRKVGSETSGPWTVVQKPSRSKAATAARGGARGSQVTFNAGAKNMGSRFIALHDDNAEIEEVNSEENKEDGNTSDVHATVKECIDEVIKSPIHILLRGESQPAVNERLAKGNTSVNKKRKSQAINKRKIPAVSRGVTMEKKKNVPGAKEEPKKDD